jgi:anaerobic selenocysteine-containing dehydrogenase
MINSEQAADYGIKDGDKISLIRKNEEFVVDVSLTDSYVQPNEI